MPLLSSPIDGSPMKEIERYGIKLDLCPTSGGVWFDKGEVEKLIHYVREETIKEMSEGGSEQRSHDHQSMRDHDRPIRKRRERENPLAELFDIFEF
ncbi:MAG: zf-TFIIB domain-containing protein [Pseudomonadota bacterium]